jgi:hypothetical protein
MIRYATPFLLALFALFSLPVATPSEAMQSQQYRECPRTSAQFGQTRGAETCYCSAAAVRSGNVWGTDIYTDDSSVCRAALHAGRVGPGGGNVRVVFLGARASYQGSTRHGVTSRNYGRWEHSFRFVAGDFGGAPNDRPGYGGGGGGVAACPNNAVQLRGSNQSLQCRCDARTTRSGNVWGTRIYTDDSAICRAAVHAGVIGERGGIVTLWARPGRRSYNGSYSNGVRSRDYGRWSGSYEFSGGGGGGNPPPDYGRVEDCPGNATSLRGNNRSLRCRCSASDTRSGAVWGTDIYTDDSNICRAALHAGAIGRQGGIITVWHRPGRSSYRGSYRNGVETRNYGRWGGSFEVR